MKAAVVLLGIAFWICVPCNLFGWWMFGERPFNWRVFLGPWVHYNWAKRQIR